MRAYLLSAKYSENNYVKGRELLEATISLREWSCSFFYVRIVDEQRPSRFLSIDSLTDYAGGVDVDILRVVRVYRNACGYCQSTFHRAHNMRVV